MVYVLVQLHAAALHLRDRIRVSLDDRGQTTPEYALVLLGAAGIALTLAAWAAKSGKITHLFDVVIDQLLSKF
jgi:hypothetical protein